MSGYRKHARAVVSVTTGVRVRGWGSIAGGVDCTRLGKRRKLAERCRRPHSHGKTRSSRSHNLAHYHTSFSEAGQLLSDMAARGRTHTDGDGTWMILVGGGTLRRSEIAASPKRTSKSRAFGGFSGCEIRHPVSLSYTAERLNGSQGVISARQPQGGKLLTG
jgi:hypothetical protein